MHITKALQARAAVVLLAMLLAPACSVSIQRATAIANEELSAAGVRMKNHVQAEYDAGRLPDPELRVWKRQLGRMADAGTALSRAIIAGNSPEASVQITAIIGLLDELLREDVVRLPPNSQTIIRIAIESVRMTLLIISAQI